MIVFITHFLLIFSIMGDGGGYYGVVYRMLVRGYGGDVMEWDDM